MIVSVPGASKDADGMTTEDSLFEKRLNEAGEAFNRGRFAVALEGYRRALAQKPDSELAAFNVGVVQEALGDVDAALDRFRSLKDGSLRLRVLIRLAKAVPEEMTDRDLADLSAVGDGSPVLIDACFALAEALEHRGRFDAAFAAFARGNALKRATLPTGYRDAALRATAAARSTFTADFLQFHAGDGLQERSPIFIIGLPRSGSTLIEQILATHPRVQGLGEVSYLTDVLAGQYPTPLSAPKPASHFRSLARRYLEAANTGARRSVDKTLSNDLQVGAIHLMFPKAVILHSQRAPEDALLASYRKLFLTGNDMSYDLDDLVTFIRDRKALMRHWEAVLPGRVIPVSNEALIADPEAQIRRLLDICGLSWEPKCLEFFRTRRPVRTASAYQVRRPLNTEGVGRWRLYEAHLADAISALNAP